MVALMVPPGMFISIVPPGMFTQVVPPGMFTPVVPPGMFTPMFRAGMGILLCRETATDGGHSRGRSRPCPLTSMGRVRGDGHIDSGPRADHHIGTVQAHHPVRDICRGEKHRSC